MIHLNATARCAAQSAAVILSLCMFVEACTSTDGTVKPQSCITGPFAEITAQRDVLFDIAAKLEQVPLDGSLKTRYTNILEQDFMKLTDDNVALLLFLQAIDCYLQHAKTPEARTSVELVVRELAQTVRQRYAVRVGVSGNPQALSDSEREEINKSSLKNVIYARLAEFGITKNN